MVTVSYTDASQRTFHATNYLLHYAGSADENNEKRVFIVIVIGLIIFSFPLMTMMMVDALLLLGKSTQTVYALRQKHLI